VEVYILIEKNRGKPDRCVGLPRFRRPLIACISVMFLRKKGNLAQTKFPFVVAMVPKAGFAR